MGRRNDRASLIGGIAGGVVLAVILGAAAFVIAPTIWRASAVHVAETDELIELQTPTSRASITVPAGWSYRGAGTDEADVRSPNGAMEVVLRLTADTRDEPESIVASVAPGELSGFNTEPFGTGTLVHARTTDGEAVAGALLDDGAVLTFVSTPTPDYDAELANLLAGIELQSSPSAGRSP